MKRNVIILVSVLLAVTLAVGGSIAMAAKPPDTGKPHAGEGNQIIARPNGFPAGPHFNLNIHGKKADYVGDPTPGGNSVFILEYGNSTIQYVSNKKASLTELTVRDPLAEAFDGDPAVVQLPSEEDGYFVYGRILGKPNNGNLEPVSSIILYPNKVIAACNDPDPANPDFPGYTDDCPDDPLLALGLIIGPNLYIAKNATYERFDPEKTKGKGKSKATDITELFTYTGWVVDARLDVWPVGDPDGDGQITQEDVPADASNTTLYPGIGSYDIYEPYGFIDVEEWLSYQADQTPPMAWYYDGVWILNIADLVITEQGLVNDGTKLLQIRFYPKDETTFG